MHYAPKYKSHPLMSWDLSGRFYWESKTRKTYARDLLELTELSTEFNWNIDLKEILSHSYEALVLTDSDQIIRWVNNGFTSMTGYPSNHAIGKNPKFLQGENTSKKSVQNIGNKLLAGEPFTEVVTNYRKNHQEYLCEVSIFPLINEENEITHFLALESETQ